ncbi:ABC-F family ATP-binding cassette domain-containing protein [Chelatococcus asaccharovorans]|uniref:ABC-F family ATP-binding cassette domain-containing protein n=1 Tax=Chelatococcus asaccharovorans TaxID=28210 RepID=UPI00224C6563|nr:ATP-binding cassette domain-containing protein [Chelatococcus asaccharovorans]CAH1661934.1 ATP-binding protein Uup [Chelatococcus asaccharovorans]CAH1683321.1 ATP-binding protein Uup [Chelatococcus asaccharovorans]
MAPPLLLLQDIALTFGGTPLLEQASLSVSSGERLCLVGRNGSGKSTLLKIAAGLITPDRGQRFLQPGTTLRYLPQEPDLTGFSTTSAYVEAGLAPGDDTYRAQYLLEQLGLAGTEDPTRLSGGEARRAALARLLAPEPDILLLDEPTNHLDLPVIEWLESELRSLRSALVLISHDRRFMETLSRATVWLDRGTTRRLEQGFAAFEEWRDTVFEEEERDRHKLDRRIAQENDWLRYGVTARRKRNQGRLRALHAMRQERRDARRAVGDVKMTVSEGDISGKLVIEAVNISKSYGTEPVVRDLSIRIARGDRIGIVGRNGAGKTTLINMLTGQLAPDSGTVKIGANVAMASLDQGRAGLDPDVTLRDALTGGGSDTVLVGGAPKHVMSYLKDFLFTPDQANMPIGKLSGGERGRLMLARALAQPSNLLVLDEPTNDLDLETLDLLEEMIDSYSGTVILVSHDRDFLDRTVTSVLMAEGQGRWQDYAGGYSDMLAQRGAGVETTSRGNGGGAAGKVAGQAAASRSEQDERNAPKTKLSFRDKHALESLPGRMAALERDIAKLKAVLDDPDLYARDPARFAKASQAMSKAEADLAASEEEWLRLEMLREEIESGG